MEKLLLPVLLDVIDDTDERVPLVLVDDFEVVRLLDIVEDFRVVLVRLPDAFEPVNEELDLLEELDNFVEVGVEIAVVSVEDFEVVKLLELEL